MTEPDDRPSSAFLRYLPSALADPAAGDAAGVSGFSVNTLLLIAEAILVGRTDGPVEHAGGALPDHRHDGIAETIDRLPLLLDPYQAPSRFLPWLASWVGVDLVAGWQDPQRRRAIAEAVPVLGLRGLKEGLRRRLDLYTMDDEPPRIAVDDGSRVLFVTPEPSPDPWQAPGRPAPVHTLVGHGPALREPAGPAGPVAYPALSHPRCLAATPDGLLLLGDGGMRQDNPPVGPGLWRVDRTGAYVDTEDAPPRPRPVGRDTVLSTGVSGQPHTQPRALVVDDRAGSDAWQAYLVDDQALYRLRSDDVGRLHHLTATEPLGIFAPDGMVLDGGRLVVLDGGLLELDPEGDVTLVPTKHGLDLPGLSPRSLAFVGGDLIVGDVGPQDGDLDDPDVRLRRPGDLVLVDRSDPRHWRGRRLLPDDPALNPLVAPIALAADGPDALFVLDAGLRPLSGGGRFERWRAEPATLYRAELDRGDPAGLRVTALRQVTERGGFTFPTGMCVVDGTVYVCDPGEPMAVTEVPMLRAHADQVAVFVHFPGRSADLAAQTLRTVVDMVEDVKPAGAGAWINWRPVGP